MTAAQWGAPIHISTQPTFSTLEQKRQLRQTMRKARRQLSRLEQASAAKKLAQQFNQNPYFKYRKHIALYLANDGEVSTQQAIQQAWSRGQRIYLPVLNPIRKGFLWFVEYKANSVMRHNRFGIAEPDPRYNRRISPRFLNTVGFPLVAFDQHGNRLGMGGGFYDRTFEFCQSSQRNGVLPKLFGLAHRCQQVESLPTERWDIQVSGIIAS